MNKNFYSFFSCDITYRMDRERNKTIASETIEIMRKKMYVSQNQTIINISQELDDSINNTKLYKPDYEFSLPPCPNRKGLIQVSDESTLVACERIIMNENIEKVACLNFASARNPGGGFLSGAQAQEEMVARCSGLYRTLIKCPEMYEYNKSRRSLLYSDYMIYSPNVPVFRNDNGSLKDTPFLVSIISAPATNISFMKHMDDTEMEIIHNTMLNRCRKIIYRAIENDAHALVLGAFGCGVFRNNPEDVAEYFRKLLIDEGLAKYFDLIVHPIYTKNKEKNNNYLKFAQVYQDIAEFI